MYQQQLHYWYKHKQTKCPRMVFLTDLAAKIKTWQDKGEDVIVLADMNKDVLTLNSAKRPIWLRQSPCYMEPHCC